jgi:hypothetical protein
MTPELATLALTRMDMSALLGLGAAGGAVHATWDCLPVDRFYYRPLPQPSAQP